jgi:hypothetical protein
MFGQNEVGVRRVITKYFSLILIWNLDLLTIFYSSLTSARYRFYSETSKLATPACGFVTFSNATQNI